MANDSAIDKYFPAAFIGVYKLCDKDDLKASIEGVREHIRDSAIPRRHRMRTLVLLGSAVPDWHEANACHEQAEFAWRIWQRWHPAGDNSKNDTAMGELRASIDELRQATVDEEVDEDERPDDDDSDTAIEGEIALHN